MNEESSVEMTLLSSSFWSSSPSSCCRLQSKLVERPLGFACPNALCLVATAAQTFVRRFLMRLHEGKSCHDHSHENKKEALHDRPNVSVLAVRFRQHAFPERAKKNKSGLPPHLQASCHRLLATARLGVWVELIRHLLVPLQQC